MMINYLLMFVFKTIKNQLLIMIID